jgi:hypothetical protein
MPLAEVTQPLRVPHGDQTPTDASHEMAGSVHAVAVNEEAQRGAEQSSSEDSEKATRYNDGASGGISSSFLLGIGRRDARTSRRATSTTNSRERAHQL